MFHTIFSLNLIGPYKSSNGYASEPERNDYGSVPNPVKPSGTGFHIPNPGKIENYIPGNSSLRSQENIDVSVFLLVFLSLM